MASPPQKISLYDLSALKAQTDDTIPTLLTALRAPYTLTPSHTHTHIRLALGYSAVLIAATLFVADYRLGWAATKPWTLPACLAYFALNAALTTWIWFGEKGKVFVGKREGGQVLTLTSTTPKFTPTYTLQVNYTAPSGRPLKIPATTISAPFTEFFNMHGFLDRKALKRWLAGNIEVVGLGDPDAKREWDEMETERRDLAEVEGEIVSQGAARVKDEGGVRRRRDG